MTLLQAISIYRDSLFMAEKVHRSGKSHHFFKREARRAMKQIHHLQKANEAQGQLAGYWHGKSELVAIRETGNE